MRRLFNDAAAMTSKPVLHACFFLYLNKTGYRGLYRENQDGQFNVPWGGVHSGARLYDAANLLGVAAYLRGNRVALLCASYEQALQHARRGDFVYLDPPYDGAFHAYSAQSFGDAQQEALAAAVQRLHRCGVRFVLSNAPTERVLRLYAGFPLCVFRSSRSIAAGKAAAGGAQASQPTAAAAAAPGFNELVVCNFDCA